MGARRKMQQLVVAALAVFGVVGVLKKALLSPPSYGIDSVIVPKNFPRDALGGPWYHSYGHGSDPKKTLPKAAVVYLVSHLEDNERLRTSLADLAETCSFVKHYPIYLMLTPGCAKHRCWGQVGKMYCRSPHKCHNGKPMEAIPDSYKTAPFNKLNLQLVDVSEQFGNYPNTSDPKQKHIAQDNPSWDMNRHHWSYRAMCNFWINGVMEVPEVKKLDFYMRMDTDSRFQCRHEDYDPFMHMYENDKIVYGLFSFIEDAISVTRGLNQFVAGYLKEHTEIHAPKEQMERYWTNPIADSKPPSFYNNLEIVRIAWFQRPDVLAFNKAIDDSVGIWSYRWGDACIRYAQLMLFARPVDDSMLCLDLITDLAYAHASAGYALRPWCTLREQKRTYGESEKLTEYVADG